MGQTHGDTRLRDKDGKIIDILSWDVHDIATTITPEIAEQLLGRNADYNRNIREARVRGLVQAMTDGDFVDTGATLSVDTSGTVIDGQHRLTACVRSGVPFTAVVVTGLDPEAYDSTDKGSKRTVGDSLKRHGFVNPNRVAALVRILMAWSSGARESNIINVDIPEPAMIAYALDHREEMAAVVAQPMLVPSVVPGRVSDLVRVLTTRVDPEDAAVFSEAMRTGETEFTGLRLAREAMMRDRIGTSRGPFWQLGMLLRTWNLWREGTLSDKRAPVFVPGGSKANRLPTDLV